MTPERQIATRSTDEKPYPPAITSMLQVEQAVKDMPPSQRRTRILAKLYGRYARLKQPFASLVKDLRAAGMPRFAKAVAATPAARAEAAKIQA